MPILHDFRAPRLNGGCKTHTSGVQSGPMNPTPGPRNRTLIALASQYCLYFGVLGVFLPYFNLYCFHLGLSAFEIGLLSSVRSVTMTLMPIAWSLLADRFLLRKQIYIFCNGCAALSWSLFLLTGTFSPMAAVTALYGFFFSPVISFLEAFSMDTLGPEKKRYGSIRVWGSISFITVVTVLGRILDEAPLSLVIWLILAGSILQTAVAFFVPKSAPRSRPQVLKSLCFMWDIRIFVFLFSAVLMLMSHGAYYGFFSIRLEALGMPNALIGVAWAVASIVEVPVMFLSGKLFRRFSPESVLIVSFLAAGLRWALLATLSSPWFVLATQVLHAFTYAAFHMASILYMDRLTPEGSKTIGQSVNNAMTYGFGFMVGFLMSGWLFEAAGPSVMFWVSAGIALTGGAIFFSFVKLRRSDCLSS